MLNFPCSRDRCRVDRVASPVTAILKRSKAAPRLNNTRHRRELGERNVIRIIG